jgi:hypothetical protein
MRASSPFLVAAVFLAACAPKPCTKALCPVSSDGLFQVRGVTAVAVPAGAPLPAVPPDATVDVLTGRAEFKVRKSRVVAETASSFRFFLSSGQPALDVTAGVVSVGLSSAALASAATGVILLQ